MLLANGGWGFAGNDIQAVGEANNGNVLGCVEASFKYNEILGAHFYSALAKPSPLSDEFGVGVAES